LSLALKGFEFAYPWCIRSATAKKDSRVRQAGRQAGRLAGRQAGRHAVKKRGIGQKIYVNLVSLAYSEANLMDDVSCVISLLSPHLIFSDKFSAYFNIMRYMRSRI
jgi:hypothetical protein